MDAKDRCYSPWDRPWIDPRFIRQWDCMEADLQQQSASIRGIPAQYDTDELLVPLITDSGSSAAKVE